MASLVIATAIAAAAAAAGAAAVAAAAAAAASAVSVLVGASAAAAAAARARQHMSGHVRIRSIRQHTSAYDSIRQHHTSAYVSIRQHTSAYLLRVRGAALGKQPVHLLLQRASKARIDFNRARQRCQTLLCVSICTFVLASVYMYIDR